jgi:uncharacterized membrane protein
MQVFIWLALVAILIFFLVKMNNLLKRTEELEINAGQKSDLKLILHRLGELEKEIRQLKDLAKKLKPPEPLPHEEISIEEEEIEAPQKTPSQPSPQVIPRSQVIRPAIPSNQPFQGSQRTFTFETVTKPSRTREEWEALIGGKLLNRIGALALMMGIGFFLKYAFDKNWITETLRVLIGIAIGVVLLFMGSVSHKKDLRIFAQGLIGAGISILYLTVYASFNFYHLVPQVVAFLMMAAVTIITFSQAFKYDSLAVSVLGWAGGFLTPFLLSTGKANEVGLFSYVVLLDVGLLIVFLRKDSWIILGPLAFAATYLTYLLWYWKFYTPADLSVTLLFLSIFWGLFYAIDVCRIITSNAEFREVRQMMATLNAAFYYWALYTIINPRYHNRMGLITLGIGTIYFLTVLGIKRRWPDDTTVLARYFLTAIVLLIVATTIQFSGLTTVIYWSLEAMILVWCGIHWRLRYVWQATLGLLCIALIKLLVTEGALSYSPIREFSLIFNRRAFAFSILTITLFVSALLLNRQDKDVEEWIRRTLHALWCILLFVLCTVETNDYFRSLMLGATGRASVSLEFTRLMLLPTIWIGYSLLLVWFGLKKEIVPILYCGLCAFALAVVLGGIRGITFEPIEKFVSLINVRAIALFLIIIGAFTNFQWLKKHRQVYGWTGKALGVLQIILALLILDLVTGEIWDYFGKPISLLNKSSLSSRFHSELSRLTNLRQLSISGAWLVYSIILMGIGILRRVRRLRIISIALFGVTILKIFIYDLSFLETLYRIFSFVGLGLILLATSYLYQRYKVVILETGRDD